MGGKILRQRGFASSSQTLILDALRALEPFDHVMELGCGGGANLSRIGWKYPCNHVTGIDISRAAIDESGNLLRQTPCHYSLLQGDASNPKTLECLACDVLITDAMLIYVTPRRLIKLMAAIKEVARVGVVLCEWHSEQGPFKDGNWVHNYSSFFDEFVMKPIKWEIWEDALWSKYGRVIMWKKPKPEPISGV